jgi:hypothetical protein
MEVLPGVLRLVEIRGKSAVKDRLRLEKVGVCFGQ